MSATKSDYLAIAAAIHEEVRSANTWIEDSCTDTPNRCSAMARRLTAERIARACADHFAKNPRFDRAEFLKNCGVQS